MQTWKTHLAAMLRRLAATHAQTPIRELERLLASILDAQSVSFRAPDGTPLRDDTTLTGLRDRQFVVQISVLGTAPSASPAPDAAVDRPTAADVASRFRSGEAPTVRTPSDRYEEFIRHFARLEERHDFMWAGYVVRELLPRIGFLADEAKLILDRLCSQGILTIRKVPNPKNPSFPATGVALNREHPQVKAILEGDDGSTPPQPSPATPAESTPH